MLNTNYGQLKISQGIHNMASVSRTPTYRIQSKNFKEIYKLGDLSYLSDARAVKESEKNLLQLLIDASLCPKYTGIFSITDVNGTTILIPTSCMQIIEVTRHSILECMDKYRHRIKNGLLPSAHQTLFEFAHPIGNKKLLIIRGRCLKVIDSNVTIRIEMCLDGIETFTDCNDLLEYNPIVYFNEEGFLDFLCNFFPCVGLYNSGIIIQNFDLPRYYVRRRRRKADNSFFFDKLSYEDHYITSFKNKNQVVLMY